MKPIFVTGTGTDVGKTLVAAIITEALQADYWKPIQSGYEDGTDALTIKSLISNEQSVFYDEVYRLKEPTSPHIAARLEDVIISLEDIHQQYLSLINTAYPSINRYLIIEGAGGLLVTLNDNEFILDLIKKLEAQVILVSRNYLGSINHSLLTASVCKANHLDVLGCIFTDEYPYYNAEEISKWSGITLIAEIPRAEVVDKNFIYEQAMLIKDCLLALLD